MTNQVYAHSIEVLCHFKLYRDAVNPRSLGMNLADDPRPILAPLEGTGVVEDEVGVGGEADYAREGRVSAARQVHQPLQLGSVPVELPEGRAVGPETD